MDVIEIIGSVMQLILWCYYSAVFIFSKDKTSNKTLYHGISAIFWMLLLKF